MPKENTGMTVTSRLDAQHSLLLAMRADINDLRADVNDLKERVTRLEDGMGKALWGISEIKNLLRPQATPP